MTDKQVDPAELELVDMCQGKDWFGGVGRDGTNRLVVYVHYMNGDILRFVPDYTRDGRQVLTHFAASAQGKKEDYFVKTFTPLKQVIEEIVQEAYAEGPEAVEELEAFTAHFQQERLALQEELETEKNVQYLTDELDRLEKICGTNILGDLLFEVHDGKNAVTNLGTKFPEVKHRMHKLYDRFGFDLLYEHMEL